MSLRYFGKTAKVIQVDCDWTKGTAAIYFDLLNSLKAHYELDVTIRLHQIKYANDTGIPPVDHGTLMLYDTGDMSNMFANSILTMDDGRSYISNERRVTSSTSSRITHLF